MEENLRRASAGVLAAVSSVLLILILLMSSIELVAFDLGYYKREYAKLERPQAIGISEEDLMRSTEELLNYLRDKRDDLNIKAVIHGEERLIFNPKEISHMVDVKNLFQAGYRFRNWALAAVIISWVLLYLIRRWRMLHTLAKAFIFTALGLTVLFGILILLISSDFTKYWDQFHYIFFSNDLWQLDPQTDILIQMVPEQFFFDTVMRIIKFFLGGMVILGILFGSLLIVGKQSLARDDS